MKKYEKRKCSCCGLFVERKKLFAWGSNAKGWKGIICSDCIKKEADR